MLQQKEIQLRSEEVQEILTRVPHWIIRWGNVVILLILLSILTISAVIKYPEIITANIIITTQTPPEKLVARTSGQIERILVVNNQDIVKNTPLAIIENTADYKAIFKLESIMDTLKISNTDFKFPFNRLQNLHLGEVHEAFAVFEKDYLAYKLYKNLHPYSIENNAQNYEVIQLKRRLFLLLEQKRLSENELKLKKNELERYRKLYIKGVIATQEWDTKNIEYLHGEKNIKNLNSSISQMRSAINELDRNSKTTKINQTKDDVNLFRNAILSYNRLRKAIRDWELNYVLRSSIAGKVSFLQIWTENQFIESGENVFTIIPVNQENYIGKIKATTKNSGKIKIGQEINIRLINYPDREFGILKGKVRYISLIPDKEGHLHIDVSLPNKLKTSYNKKITFRQEMTGTADIITEDLTLLQRLLYQFRDVFNRKQETVKTSM